MVERVEAWQCIGCGKLEAPQPCIGVCKDRKVKFVYASDYEEAVAELARAQARASTLLHLVSRLAHTAPHPGQWETSFKALQLEARKLLQDART